MTDCPTWLRNAASKGGSAATVAKARAASKSGQPNPQGSLHTVVRAPDRRTKEGRRAEIIAQVEESGGFSVFWITAHRLRAVVGTEMLQRGELVETRKSSFPWHALKLVGRGGWAAVLRAQIVRVSDDARSDSRR